MSVVNVAIRKCVEQTGDPLLRHIILFCKGLSLHEQDVRDEVKAMVERKELRMKEDEIDHEWSYRKGSGW